MSNEKPPRKGPHWSAVLTAAIAYGFLLWALISPRG